jgi:hypothetical protein
MKMPGFTAEAAVYDSDRLTYGMAGVDAPAKGAVVVPQVGICRNVGPCRFCLDLRIFPPRACVSVTCPIIGTRRFCVP